jgi:hypothetical protein
MKHGWRIKVRHPFKLSVAGEPVCNQTVSFDCGEKVYWVMGGAAT